MGSDGPACFYRRIDEQRFLATAATVGPWSSTLQHGGPPAALCAHALERTAPREGARIARLSIEILGPIALGEMVLATEIVRPGKKVEQLAATVSIGGRPVLRATAWRLQAEPGRSPEVGPGEAAPPLPDREDAAQFEGAPRFGYGEAMEWRFVAGGFLALGPSTVWARPRVPLIEGEPWSPLCRVMAMVDSANGVSAELPFAKWSFLPVDLTVVAERHPDGEWTGMHAATTIASDGVGMTRARLFDPRGALGASLQTLYVAPR